jgi:ADP-heptose:LPS heptosyltransferase
MMEETKKKIILRNGLSPGDTVMLTAAVRELATRFPGKFEIGVETPSPQLWQNNPHVTGGVFVCGKKKRTYPADVEVIHVDYPLIQRSDREPWHFLHAMMQTVSEKLKLPGPPLYPTKFGGDIHLSDAERNQIPEALPEGVTKYWVIVAGGKSDITIKWWSEERWREVARLLTAAGIHLVQVGLSKNPKHRHFNINGKTSDERGASSAPVGRQAASDVFGSDVFTDLRGKTSQRDLIQLVYHSQGVISPVSFAMHLAAAVPQKPGHPKTKPCVVVAGAREPAHWEAYTGHRFLETCGSLFCCDQGGCWKSRTLPLGDKHDRADRLCQRPVKDPLGDSILPECMAMITPQQVVDAVFSYAGVTGMKCSEQVGSDDFEEAMRQVAPIADQLGIDIEETYATIGMLRDVCIQPLQRTESPPIKNFYVCSYGGSCSHTLTKFLSNFGKAHHIHSRELPEPLTKPVVAPWGKVPEHFGNEPVDANEEHYVLFIFNRPEIALTRSNTWCQMHWRNINAPASDVFDELKSITPAEYLADEGCAENEDVFGLLEFFENYHNTTTPVIRLRPIALWYPPEFERLREHLGLPIHAGSFLPNFKPPKKVPPRSKRFLELNRRIDEAPLLSLPEKAAEVAVKPEPTITL